MRGALSWAPARAEAQAGPTIATKQWALREWAKHFGTLRLAMITTKSIYNYLEHRKQTDKVSNRTINLQMIALRNLWPE